MELALRVYKKLPSPVQGLVRRCAYFSLQIFSRVSRFYVRSIDLVRYEIRRKDTPFIDVRFTEDALFEPFANVHTIECFDYKESLTISDSVFDNIKHLGVQSDTRFLILSEVRSFCNISQNCTEIVFHVYPWETLDGHDNFCLKQNEPMFIKNPVNSSEK